MTSEDRRISARTRVSGKSVVLTEDSHLDSDLRDISASGAQLALRERPEVGSNIVVFTEEFGRLEATVERHTVAGIGLSFQGGEQMRKSLLRRLTAYADRLLGKSFGQANGSHRLFLETLAISGRVAAERTDRSAAFWTMVEDCEGRGWVRSDSLAIGFQTVEITQFGRAQLAGGH